MASNINWLTGSALSRLIALNADEETQLAFRGVYAVNTLPARVPYPPALLIVNSDPSNLAGKHWRAIYIDDKGHGEIFDSLAIPVGPLLEAWINSVTIKWTCSEAAIQSPFAPSCGAFVLHFILHRLSACTLQSYSNTFYTPGLYGRNETFIRCFVNRLKQ